MRRGVKRDSLQPSSCEQRRLFRRSAVLLHAKGVQRMTESAVCIGLSGFLLALTLQAAPNDLIPPVTGIRQDRPRLLLRPTDTPLAISL